MILFFTLSTDKVNRFQYNILPLNIRFINSDFYIINQISLSLLILGHYKIHTFRKYVVKMLEKNKWFLIFAFLILIAIVVGVIYMLYHVIVEWDVYF